MKGIFNVQAKQISYAGMLILTITSIYFFFVQVNIAPCCDQTDYLALANNIHNEGIVSAQNVLRTFGYPWFLSILIKISVLINMPLILILFIAQAIIYLLVIIRIRNIVYIHSPTIADVIFFVFCLNIFVAPYFANYLTDSIYLSLCLLVLINITKYFIEGIANNSLLFWTAAAFSTNIIIRPAAIWLLFPMLLFLLHLFITKRKESFSIFFFILLGLTPLFIQTYLNFTKYGALSFLPIQDLGAAQLKWGIENIKYSTWLGGGNPQNFYPSSKIITLPTNIDAYTISWYFSNFTDGLTLLSLKFIGAFDFDFLVPFPKEIPSLYWIPSIFSYVIMWLGIFGIIFHLTTGRLFFLGHRLLPITILLSWGSVTLLTALELRFTLPLISYLMYVSVIYFFEMVKEGNKKYLYITIGGLSILIPSSCLLASIIRDQSHIYAG